MIAINGVILIHHILVAESKFCGELTKSPVSEFPTESCSDGSKTESPHQSSGSREETPLWGFSAFWAKNQERNDTMKKIAYVREIPAQQTNLPKEVIDTITDIATVLDNEYGNDRDVNGGNGGYILIIEDKEELYKLTDIYIDIDTIIPEYVDRIQVRGGQHYTNTLLILGSDFTISLVMPLEVTPERFITEYPGEGWQE